MHLYIHVPFCRSKCLYCAFLSRGYDPELVSAYVPAVCEEIRYWGQALGRPETATVYFGGGTPSLMGLADLESILRTVRDHFAVSPEAECSLEANPDSCCADGYLEQLPGLGINRLSLGLQSLDDADLAFLGRRHTAEQGQEACRLARKAGFDNLSVDILWALPGQDEAKWTAELRALKGLGVRHVSAYALSIESGTELEKLDESGRINWPGEDEQARMYLQCLECLQAMGLAQYEISNFAGPGYACAHNIGYWQGRDYLGVGPSAVSCIGSRRWKNPSDVLAYCASPVQEAGFFQCAGLSLREQANELIMLGLRMVQGVSLDAYAGLSGEDLLAEHEDLIAGLEARNLIAVDQERLRLTPQGMLVSDSLIPCFFH